MKFSKNVLPQMVSFPHGRMMSAHIIQSELEIALISGLFPSFPNESVLGYNHQVLVTRIRISLLSLLLVHSASVLYMRKTFIESHAQESLR